MIITQSVTAVAANIPASFLASGGTGPYSYAVLPGGAGGAIDAATGAYRAPAQAQSDPTKAYDTIQATDALNVTATAQILVGNPLLLFCEILWRELGLDPSRVYLWDQKIMQPTDAGLYIAVSVPSCKPFASTMKTVASSGLTGVQVVNMLATLDIDIISRDAEARDRKEEVLLALNSQYAQSQQEVNSFYIGKLPPGARFTNLSLLDGAAIPYRFKISMNVQYAVTKSKAVPYFDTFDTTTVTTDP